MSDIIKKKIVSIAAIPCASSGHELFQLINQYSTKYECRYILGRQHPASRTIPQRVFPTDLNFLTQREECLKTMRQADIIHIHHDSMLDNECDEIIKTKPTIVTLYNLCNAIAYSNSKSNQKYMTRQKRLANLLTVADQPCQKLVFADITTTTVPLVKMLYNLPIERNNEIPHVVFAPTNRDKFGIGRKMYSEVLEVIKQLQDEGLNFKFTLIEGMEYYKNLEIKKSADIIIDDVDPNYHKSHNTCYSSDTKVLTNEGWKLFNELKITDLIYSFNKNTGEIELSGLRRIVYEKYNGEMYHVENQRTDLLITPNHRMIFIADIRNPHWQILPIKDIASRAHLYLPSKTKGFSLIKNIPSSSCAEYKAKLLGLFLSDGTSEKNSVKWHLRKKSTVNMVMSCLLKMNVHHTCIEHSYVKNKIDYTIRVPNHSFIDFKEYRESGNTMTKRVPAYMFKQPPKTIEAFLDGFIEGDGTINKDGHSVIYSANKLLLEDIQHLYLLIGIKTNICRTHKKNGTNVLYRIYITSSKYACTRRCDIKHKRYDGYVGCVELCKNNIIYVKRNEKCSWSGNSMTESPAMGIVPLTNFSSKDYPLLETNIYTLKDQLIKLITNKGYLKKEQERIYKWFNNDYSPQKLIKKYERLYDKLLLDLPPKQDKKFYTYTEVQEEISKAKKEASKEIIDRAMLTVNKLDFLKKLNSENLTYWLLGDTCCECVEGNLKSDLHLGTNNSCYEQIKKLAVNLNIFVKLEIEQNRNVKDFGVQGVNVKVPLPVIGYIKQWRKK